MYYSSNVRLARFKTEKYEIGTSSLYMFEYVSNILKSYISFWLTYITYMYTCGFHHFDLMDQASCSPVQPLPLLGSGDVPYLHKFDVTRILLKHLKIAN